MTNKTIPEIVRSISTIGEDKVIEQLIARETDAVCNAIIEGKSKAYSLRERIENISCFIIITVVFLGLFTLWYMNFSESQKEKAQENAVITSWLTTWLLERS